MNLLNSEWAEDCQGAITLLGTGRNLPTPQMTDLVDAALRKVVQVRDGLIGQLREGASGTEHAALDQINVALSELASVQYPGALEREHIDTARGLLLQLVGEGAGG